MDDIKLSADSVPPTDAKTLMALVERFTAETPLIDDQVAALLKQYPQLRNPRGGFQLGRLVAIWTLNFLCRAYDRPDLGYRPSTGAISPHN